MKGNSRGFMLFKKLKNNVRLIWIITCGYCQTQAGVGLSWIITCGYYQTQMGVGAKMG